MRGKMANLKDGELSTPQAARACGLHPRTLCRWVTRGVLRPRNAGGDGHGRAPAWNGRDLVAARLIARLRACGLSAQKVKKACRAVVNKPGGLAGRVLVTDGKNIFDVVPHERIVGLLKTLGQLYMFPLEQEEREIQKEVMRIKNRSPVHAV